MKRFLMRATLVVMLGAVPAPGVGATDAGRSTALGAGLPAAQSFTVSPGQAKRLEYDQAVLEIQAGSVSKDTTVTIAPLADKDLPFLDQGMTNATAGPRRGYRLLPHHMKFNKKITIKLPYDRTMIPAGLTEQDLKTFFFDESTGKWQELERVQVDTKKRLVVSLSDHFTDFINATITVPDHPDVISDNPNTMKDIQSADPAAGINLIAPPTANNMGEAHLSYPIELPPGRNGMQPELAVSYNSMAGNGWLGLGWDLNLPEIRVETRWGVPRYDASTETETYLLNGQQLTPLAHRADPVARSTGDKVFHLRVEGTFARIVRHGNAPTNYWWEITDKNGVRFTYGDPPGTPSNDTATLTDDSGNVFKWALREARDLSGNGVRYTYQRISDVGVAGGTVAGWQLYLKTINYTQSNGASGAYTVEFSRDSELPGYSPADRRPDVQIDARGGFKMVTAELLKRISVTFNGSPVRSYDLEYQEGAFRKTLLHSITQRGENGAAFNTHTFSYYDDVRNGNVYNGFGPEQDWSTGQDNVNWATGSPAAALLGPLLSYAGFGEASGISGAVTDAGGGHLYLGFNPTAPTKQFSVGGKIGFNVSSTDTVLALMDINGDALPDKVYKATNSNIYFRLNQSGPNGTTTFGPPVPIPTLPDIAKEDSLTFSFGAEGYAIVSAFANDAETFTTSSVYFTDANGDGLPDLVDNGTIYFNHLKLDPISNVWVPTFSQNSADTEVPLGPSAAIDTNGIVEDYSAIREKAIDTFPLQDTLRRWIAPYDGQIKITAPVHLIQDTSPGRAQYKTADGVRVAIQQNGTELWQTTIGPDDYATKTPTGVDAINVTAGDRIYFRVGSVFDGKYDQVAWDPQIEYTGVSAVTDVNGLEEYTYKASGDFTLAGRRGIGTTLPIKGTVRLTGDLQKLGVTTDDVMLEVKASIGGMEQTLYTKSMAWNQTGAIQLQQDINVSAMDAVSLTVRIDSPIDLKQLSWQPKLVYTAAADPNQVIQDSQGNPLFVFYPPYDIDIYPVSNLTAPQQGWVAPQDGTLTVVTDLAAPDPAATGNIFFTVKSPGSRRAKVKIPVAAGTLTNVQVPIQVTKGDLLYFDYSVYDPELAALVTSTGAIGSWGDPSSDPTFPLPTAQHSGAFPGLFAQPYRGWAYAGYNGNRDRATQPINEADLNSSYTESSTYDAQSAKAYLFYPAPEDGLWRGPDDLGYAGPDTLSSSRLGMDYISVPDKNSVATGNAVSRLSRTSQVAAGAGVSIVSGSYSGDPKSAVLPALPGSSYGAIDYLDMNGDGFPDIVANGRIQYTNMLGGLEASAEPVGGLGQVRENRAGSENFGVGGNAATFKAGAGGDSQNSGNGSPKESKSGSQMTSIGIFVSGSLGLSTSEVRYDLIDVNGDGLPDRVMRDGAEVDGQTISCGADLCVALNLGYKFASPEPWGAADINEGAGRNFNLGASLGYNGGIYDFAGGFSLDKNSSQSACRSIDPLSGDCSDVRTSFEDLNGDGLVDRVRADSQGLSVGFNTGNGFAPEVRWTGALDNRVALSGNSGIGGGLYFTIGIGPLCWPTPLCYIIINPGGDYSRSIARVEVQMRDINGDGFADQLTSSSDDKIEAALNQTGRTNLLRLVERPLGGKFELDYQRDGNTLAMSQSRWVLSRIALSDGQPGDGVDTQVTTFKYEGGYHDSLERDFYGYAKVTEEHRDAANGDALYRSVVREYSNDSFYTKGLQKTELMQDAAGNPYLEVLDTYELRDVDTGLPGDPKSVAASIFPQMVRTEQRQYEGNPGTYKTTHTDFTYDAVGNIAGFLDAGDTPTADDALADVQYATCASTYVVGLPLRIVVKDVNGNELRHREANVDCNSGKITQVRQYPASGDPAITDLTYDKATGNLITVVGPENIKKQRYTLSYQYDPVVASHITQIQDSFGLTSSATYVYKYGLTESTTDANGNTVSYAYDAFGRPDAITGPYEQGTGQMTVDFQYDHTAPVPWAMTRRLDTFRNPADPIDTVVFIDGLKRVLQTKKDGTVFTGPDTPAQDMMIVSGRVKFDLVGRPVERYYPTTGALGTPTTFNPAYDAVTPTVTHYDVLDRITSTKLPDGTSTTYAFDFGQDRSGMLQHVLTVTDANGNQKKTYRDSRKLAVAFQEFNAGQPVWASYVYDPLQQLTSITDDKNNVTTFVYDNLGRRVSTDNPDSGKTETTYDLASHMISKVTANLRAKGEQIAYSYDFGRLMAISYPDFPANNVTYTYGATGATENRAGRITSVTDQSGKIERFYGKLGEVVREVKTISSFIGNPSNPDVYTTRYLYDTFGRLQVLTYPDGEVLTYRYDSGGLAQSAEGQKGGFSYPYVTRMEYDKFEQRAFVEDGNGVRTAYSYRPDNRRLDSLQAGKTGNSPFENLQYEYDNVGNVMSLANAVPVPAASEFGGPTLQTFTYDDLYRLTGANGSYQFAPDKVRRYGLAMSYDSIYNILSKQQYDEVVQPSGSAVPQRETTFDWAYTYGSAQPHEATHIGDRTFSYDANGNQTGWDHDLNGTRRTVVWNEENRVESIFDNGHEMQYKYDDTGRRVIKRGPQGETVYVNQYFTIRNGATGTKHVIIGTTRMVSKLVKKNDFEKDQYFYHPDQVGSNHYVTDLNGALYEHLEYFPFGETWVQEKSNTQRTPYLYSGKELDEETNLYYYGARYYDPRVSQYLSTDPLLGQTPERGLARPSMFNAYAYVSNNPLAYTDPTGLDPNAVTDIKVTQTTYQVPGKTLAEAEQWLKTNRPEDWGNVSVNIVEDPNALQTDASGKVVKAKITVEITVELPVWTPPAGTGPKTKAEWDRAMKSLKEHEEGHVDIGKKYATDFAKKLIGKKGQDAVDTIVNTFDENKPGKIKQEFDKYDKKTEHGKKQGTDIDLSIEQQERDEKQK